MIFLGAILNRIRGGWLSVGSTTIGRLIWAGLGLAAAAWAWDPWLLWLVPALYLGAVPGNPYGIDMGRHDGAWLKDTIAMLGRGIVWVAPTAFVLYGLGYDWRALAVVGFLCPMAYEAGWRIRPRNGVEAAEIVFGGLVGGAIALSMLE